MACRMSLSTLLFLNRLLPHLPQVMLCMLVEVLDFDRITGGSGISRKRYIVFILTFGICGGVGIRLGLAPLRWWPPGVTGRGSGISDVTAGSPDPFGALRHNCSLLCGGK